MSSVAAAYSQVPVRAKYFKAVPAFTVGASPGYTVTLPVGPQVYTIDTPVSTTGMTVDEFNAATTGSTADDQRQAVNSMYINKGKTVTVRSNLKDTVVAVYALVRPVVNGDAVTGDPGTALAVADVLVQIFDLTTPSNVRVVAA